jgi:hypothetical protein
MISKILVLQCLVAMGLLNVWLIRSNKSTTFRGGSSQSLKSEFAAYGLPSWVFFLIGTLKIGAAIALLVGIWVPVLVFPAAAVVGLLMLGALAMHMKIRDPLLKSLPAACILIMVILILKDTYQ